jgi:hypothetical protein
MTNDLKIDGEQLEPGNEKDLSLLELKNENDYGLTIVDINVGGTGLAYPMTIMEGNKLYKVKILLDVSDEKEFIYKYQRSVREYNILQEVKKKLKLEGDKKKLEDEIKKLEDDKKKLEDEKQKLEGDKKKLEDDKQKLIALKKKIDKINNKINNINDDIGCIKYIITFNKLDKIDNMLHLVNIHLVQFIKDTGDKISKQEISFKSSEQKNNFPKYSTDLNIHLGENLQEFIKNSCSYRLINILKKKILDGINDDNIKKIIINMQSNINDGYSQYKSENEARNHDVPTVKQLRFCTENKLKNYNVKGIFMEYMSAGTLCENEIRDPYKLEDIVLQIFFQILAMYRKGLVHGDLHVNNVMRTKDPNYSEGTSKYYKYQFGNKVRHVPVREYIYKIIDFDKAVVLEDQRNLVGEGDFDKAVVLEDQRNLVGEGNMNFDELKNLDKLYSINNNNFDETYDKNLYFYIKQLQFIIEFYEKNDKDVVFLDQTFIGNIRSVINNIDMQKKGNDEWNRFAEYAAAKTDAANTNAGDTNNDDDDDWPTGGNNTKNEVFRIITNYNTKLKFLNEIYTPFTNKEIVVSCGDFNFFIGSLLVSLAPELLDKEIWVKPGNNPFLDDELKKFGDIQRKLSYTEEQVCKKQTGTPEQIKYLEILLQQITLIGHQQNTFNILEQTEDTVEYKFNITTYKNINEKINHMIDLIKQDEKEEIKDDDIVNIMAICPFEIKEKRSFGAPKPSTGSPKSLLDELREKVGTSPAEALA